MVRLNGNGNRLLHCCYQVANYRYHENLPQCYYRNPETSKINLQQFQQVIQQKKWLSPSKTAIPTTSLLTSRLPAPHMTLNQALLIPTKLRYFHFLMYRLKIKVPINIPSCPKQSARPKSSGEKWGPFGSFAIHTNMDSPKRGENKDRRNLDFSKLFKKNLKMSKQKKLKAIHVVRQTIMKKTGT